jgi:lipopolysaccharide/colanic/teichoic acid biosynthesis glycosyltransferase
MIYDKYIKPVGDWIIALFVMVIFLPIFLVVMLGLAIANNGKPFFIQRRPGKNEKIFSIIKFKTMNEKTDAEGKHLPDSERLTEVGSFVRKTSLDEIPQLLNVLKGEMSIVGPRPLLPEYLPLYTLEQKRRHEVKPGITGWTQVNGRNALSWSDKFKRDVEYVEQQSFVLDCKILFLTLKKVLVSEGISQNGQVGMSKFRGNE